MCALEKITKTLKAIDAGDILDVATGSGEFVYSLTDSFKSFNSITGIDTNKKAVKAAEERFKDHKKIKFEIKDAYETGYSDESFDTVVISNSLHHFEDPVKILKEMNRILKKNGHLIISEMHSDEDQSEEQKTHVLLHHWWGEIDSMNGIVHNQTYKSNELKGIVESLDLNNVEKYTFNYPSQGNEAKSEKVKEHLNKAVDMYLNRIMESEDKEILINTGEELRKRVNDIGFETAGRVFIIGEK